MTRSWYWRLGIIIAVTLVAVWYLIPSYYSFVVLPKDQRNNVKLLNEKLPKWAPSAKYRLNLGLDLQGGIHMVMRVDTKTALQKRVERRGYMIANYLHEKGIAEVTSDSDPDRLQLTLTAQSADQLDKVDAEVSKDYGEELSKVGREGNKLTYALKDAMISRFEQDAVDQAMLVIRRRIDKWGVAEVDVRKLGTDSIQISLPGQQDPEQAKELIGTTAQLEFRMVDDAKSGFFPDLIKNSPPPANSGITLGSWEGFATIEGKDRQALLDYLKGKAPTDREILLECVQSNLKKGSCDYYRTYLVEKTVPLTGESLAGADASVDQMNEPEVDLSFDAQGGKIFGDLTEKSVGRRMAIVLDDNVTSAPRINEKIPNGHARITLGGGGKSFDDKLADANNLALVLKAGALPAPVSVGEIRQVGASLGDELIHKGSMAVGVGFLLVVFFMGIYYRGAGLIADVALLLNGLLILAGLALFNGTLTLPGLAGFILTLGIAVDANVLINERMREEIAEGKSARAVVDQGYDRAFWTIFDAHVTTLIAGVILFYTGTGPVRGFATTLIIGLLASLFTSIVVTRVITTYLVHGRNAQTVSV
jgi:preprotein translocase subunit SecD